MYPYKTGKTSENIKYAIVQIMNNEVGKIEASNNYIDTNNHNANKY